MSDFEIPSYENMKDDMLESLTSNWDYDMIKYWMLMSNTGLDEKLNDEITKDTIDKIYDDKQYNWGILEYARQFNKMNVGLILIGEQGNKPYKLDKNVKLLLPINRNLEVTKYVLMYYNKSTLDNKLKLIVKKMEHEDNFSNVLYSWDELEKNLKKQIKKQMKKQQPYVEYLKNL